MKHKLKIAAWACGILLVVLCALIYLAHVNAKSPLEEYKAKLRASGEKLAIEDWIPARVPTEQNGAELMRQVIRLRPTGGDFVYGHLPPAMRMVAPGKAMRMAAAGNS